jgi:beta-lactamase superfamily II metal-dependent hydrolase
MGQGTTTEGQMFAIEMLPAQQGDALWIEYGDRAKPSRILIDGGTPPTIQHLLARIDQVPEAERHFELVVVTHIDTDHIGGMLKLISALPKGVTIGDMWFNAWRHLPGTNADDRLGPIDGEILDRLLTRGGFSWNGAFGGHAAAVPDDPDAPLPSTTLPGGMALTVLSPTSVQLLDLKTEWKTVIHEAGLDGPDLDAGLAAAMRRKGIHEPGTLGAGTPDVEVLAQSPFTPDRAVANSTSIALLAEFDGRSCVLTGDGFAPVVASGIDRLRRERGLEGRLPVTALKVAHHGSRNNTSTDLLDMLRVGRFLVSTNGAIFHHPDQIAIARLIVHGSEPLELNFNYKSDDDRIWDDATLKRKHRYQPVFADDAANGHLRVEL